MLNPNTVVVIIYLVSMVALGIYLSRYVKSEDDFFLAGRSLNKWVIAGSIMSTNVAAIYLVGPAGAAYSGGGVSTLLIAWTGNMIAAISALFFVPHLRRMRITTISEYLEERYGVAMRLLPALLWILYYACFAGVGMCTLSTVLGPVLGVSVENLIIFVGIAVLIYCFFSGLIGAAYSSVIQAFIMILGGLILMPLALKQVGGFGGLYAKLPESYFVFWKAGTAGVWPTWKDVIMFTVLGLPYWCTSQYMVQRSFAGRSVRASSRGVILAALMTGPLTLSFIIPGICGSVLYGNVPAGDEILPLLLRDFLPVGLAGLILASLIAASNSTASALLSSLSTLAQHDFYRRFVPGKNTKHYIWVARVATLIGGLVGITFAFQAREQGIIQSVYGLMGFFEPPIFIIVTGALFWRRANTWGAACAGIVGIAFNFISRQSFGMDPATQAILSFPVSAIALAGGTILGEACGCKAKTKPNEETPENAQTHHSISGRIGIAWALLSLLAFVLCSFYESALPKPASIFIFLGLVMSFVLGCYFAVPALVRDSAEEEQADNSVGSSLTQRIVGSGWTWLFIYALSIILMLVFYSGAKAEPEKAKLTVTQIEIDSLGAAILAYQKDHDGNNPTTTAMLNCLRPEQKKGEEVKSYLRAPLDITDVWGNSFVFKFNPQGSFSISSNGPDGEANTPDDITTSFQ